MRRLLFAALVAACLAAPATASASFPGSNGEIALTTIPRSEPFVTAVNPDGTGFRYVTGTGIDAQWSPDGTRLAYTRNSDGTGIGLVNADGSGQQNLFDGPSSPFNPSWFPDGETLGAQQNGSFVTIDIATKAITVVATDASSPHVAPNGQLVTFNRGGDLWIMDADGTDQRLLAAGGRLADFSPDSSRVAFRRGDAIFVIGVDGSGEQQLTTGTEFDSSPVWSPDGTRIAFARGGDVWVMNADGTAEQFLVAGDGTDFPTDWQRIAAAAPDCSAVSASPKTLWPPNGKLRTVTLSKPSGTTIKITGVTSNHDLAAGDWKPGTTSREVLLRAKKPGRVYKVAFTLTNAAGATCSGKVKIRVLNPRRR